MNKIKPEDLEIEDTIWVPEFNEWATITAMDFPLSGKTVVTFDNGKTLFFDNRRRFQLI